MELNLNELLECQLHRWFEKFKKYTIKTISIPLPIEFVEYLKEDGIILPKGVAVPGFSDSENNGIWLSENKNDVFDCDSSNQFDFSELISEIEKAMSKLGGAVVPKLNWSCPQDSIWINSETLKCSSVGELILLLKSSDKVAQDLSLGMDHPTELIQFYVNLRKWSNLNPSQEFRCFVRGKHLIGICQRDMNGFHSQLNDKEKLNSIREVVHSFIQTSNEMFPCDSCKSLPSHLFMLIL